MRRWTALLLGLGLALAAAGCGRQEDPAPGIRDYIGENLPESYTASPLYALDVREEQGVCTASITLDMLADGSDYTGFGEDDYMMLAELEAGYLLENALKDPPAPTDFVLVMRFGEEEIRVERRWGKDWGTLSYGEAKMDISFEK